MSAVSGSSPWHTAHRAVLDHVLSLVAHAPWGDGLVLRGSMSMLAWAGADARPPGDLDWIALDRLATPVDEEHPYPHVPSIEVVQQWPEAAAGAARYEFWREEEFGTAGSRPHVPPEGLNWVPDLIAYEPHDLRAALIHLFEDRPQAAEGVVLLADQVDEAGDWAYAGAYGGGAGIRLTVPWQAGEMEPSLLQMDFAGDETMPDPPVWASVPRADGGPPTPVRAASRESSLAWKLLWLYADASDGSGAQAKDLYDAVLLAEADQTRLTPHLLNKVLRRSLREAAGEFCLGAIRVSEEEWSRFQFAHPAAYGTAQQWLERLGWAVAGSLPVG
ncbi:MAG TPA: nucleotidyl transferase AbiEii/AbiGii toxin family protein [Actinocrinis sp.]|nr:nucleotidyl transferase AbiEii/AbiGii toxin family protein [Actinocrinis sp.]